MSIKLYEFHCCVEARIVLVFHDFFHVKSCVGNLYSVNRQIFNYSNELLTVTKTSKSLGCGLSLFLSHVTSLMFHVLCFTLTLSNSLANHIIYPFLELRTCANLNPLRVINLFAFVHFIQFEYGLESI